MRRNQNPCTLLMRTKNGAATVGSNVQIPQKLKVNYSVLQQSHFWVLVQELQSEFDVLFHGHPHAH